MSPRALILVVAVFAAFAVTPARAPKLAASQESPSVAINQIDATNYPQVTAVVTVLDAGGAPVSNLTQPQFAAMVGDDAADVTAVEMAQDATLQLSVTLVIDVSVSMQGAPLAAAKDAASAFVQSLGPNDEASLFSLAGVVAPVVPFTSDKAALARGIAGLQTFGPGTALYDSVQSALYAANSREAPRKAIVLLSGGENDTAASPTTHIDSLAAARAAKVPIFTISVGAAPELYLGFLAAETQGQFRRADAASVAAAYESIEQWLQSPYVVTFDAPGEADGADALLRIEADIAGTTVGSPPVTFQRGDVPGAPTPATTPVAATPATDDSGGAPWALMLAAAGVGGLTVVLLGGGIFLVGRQRAARAQRGRELGGGAQSGQAEPPPLVAASLLTPTGGPGRIVSLNAQEQGTAFHFGDEAIIIGSGTSAHVRVPVARDIATRHAMIWLKDGKIMLRHVGGSARLTIVAGTPVEWVTLDDGEEFTVGAHRYRAEIAVGQTTAPSAIRTEPNDARTEPCR